MLGGNGKAWAQTTYYVLQLAADDKVSSIGSKELSGPGHTITFYAKKTLAAIGNLEVQQSVDNKNWTTIKSIPAGDLGTKYGNQLSATITDTKVRYIKFVNKGTLTRYVKEVKVTRATTLTTNPTSVSLGNVQLGETRTDTVSVSWNNTYSGKILSISEDDNTNALTLDVPNNDNDMGAEGSKSFSYTFSALAVGEYRKNIVLIRKNDNTTITIPVTANVVGKYTPIFSFSLASANSNHVYNLGEFFSSNNPNAYTITSDDETKAKIINGKLYVLAQSGDFYLKVSQSEDEKWYAKTEHYKVSITTETETTDTVNKGDFRMYSGVVWDTYNKQFSFPFPCQKVTYDAKHDPAAVNYLTVKVSKDHGKNWTTLENNNRNITDDRKSFTENIDPTTTHIDFIRESGSSVGLNFYNVTFHMASYMTPSQKSAAFGRTMVGNTSEGQNITIDWSNVEDYSKNLKVVCDNPNFIVTVTHSPCTPENQTWGTSNHRWGQSTITVLYNPQSEGVHSGIIYFYDNRRFITIAVNGEAYDALILSPDIDPKTQITDGGVHYSKVRLNRDLPAGHFTITFPFDYNISVIPYAYAAQLSLVTYNKADGYTLYFQKVADGLMLANQPYVVYLPESISNPEWTDITVERPEAGSVSSASMQGWSMHANYTPNFPMEGKYGLAGGLFRKGTEGSYLNAYTAYFVPPVATEARIRMAMLKDDGSATYIDSIEPGQTSSDECEIFGLDGIRLGSMKQGVNIVRMKDGSVRKVMKR